MDDAAGGLFWSPTPPPGAAQGDAPLRDAVIGDVIRVMWDYGTRVGLWDAEGQLPEDPAWLRRVLGLSDALIADLEGWAADMDGLDAAPGERRRVESAYAVLNARGGELAVRLQQELGERYRVVYKPW